MSETYGNERDGPPRARMHHPERDGRPERESTPTANKQPITILIAALGGEGGGVLAEWLVETAQQAGYPAQSTSIPGVAQRTGATTYYVEIYPEPIAALGGRRPVLSLLPVPGCVDLVVASELLEAVRTVQSGMVSAERTVLVSAIGRTLTTAEKMVPGDGRFDSQRLLDVARANSRTLVALDMDALARTSGCVVSAVMFGAIAATGIIPFRRDAYEAVIRSAGVGVEASLRGFSGAWDAVVAQVQGVTPAPGIASAASSTERTPAEPATGAAEFPLSVRDIVAVGCARLREYQDEDYVELYLARLRRVLAAERMTATPAQHACAVTRETARFLALWMAFDDIVRVAALKCRASRFARVRREVAARDGDIVRIVDHFKPGVAEFAGMLPAALAQRLLAWDRNRQARGRAPFGMALHLRTDSVLGFGLLRLLASLRWLRPRGARYHHEQALVERWLVAVEQAARSDAALAYEIAQCGRLIKGYGATNERGKANLQHIIEHLVRGGSFASTVARATAIAQAREAALADEGGKALDRALVDHGAPPRPVVAQPIRWTRKSASAPPGEHRAA
jgi:indolepyruvate ferredoxin oxidoreductase, beta subunit